VRCCCCCYQLRLLHACMHACTRAAINF
jgi:hypothetical protein